MGLVFVSPAAVDHPVIPLLAAPCVIDDDPSSSASAAAAAVAARGKSLLLHHHHHHHHSLWQPQLPQQQQQQQYHPLPPPLALQNPTAFPYLKKPLPMLDAGPVSTCQDCGNQAKKDCTHRRCRTCCKSRGFDCSTHVKSTWVPASRRRERHLAAVTAAAGSSASTSASKKPRLSTSHSTSNSSASQQDVSFRDNLPGQVRAPAVFKCVRVTSVDDGEDEYAYQAMVTIGGHVFKGFLYDQGMDDGSGGEMIIDATRHHHNIHNLSELHLGGGGGAPADLVGGLLAGNASSFGGNPIN